MPPKGRRRASSSTAKAPRRSQASVKGQPSLRAEIAADVESMSLSRLRSSLAPVACGEPRCSSSQRAPTTNPLPTAAAVKPGLLLRSRARGGSTTTTLPAKAFTVQLIRNEEEGPSVAPVTRTTPAMNEEEERPPRTATNPKAFTVSTSSAQSASRESLDRLRAAVDASLSLYAGTPAPPTGASRGSQRAAMWNSMSAFAEKSVNALKMLRTATTSDVPATTVIPLTPPPVVAVPATTATANGPPQRRVRVVRGRASTAAPDAAPSATTVPFAIPAPRSAATKPAAVKRGRQSEESGPQTMESIEPDTCSPVRGAARIEIAASDQLRTPPDVKSASSSPSKASHFSIPAPRSQQTCSHETTPTSSLSLAALRAATARQETSASVPNSLFKLAEVVQSAVMRGLSPRDPGESSPLSRASFHSENLSTPLRAQLHDTRSFVERYQSGPQEPAAQPFRVVGSATSRPTDAAATMTALRSTLSTGPLARAPTAGASTEVIGGSHSRSSQGKSASARSQNRRRSAANAPASPPEPLAKSSLTPFAAIPFSGSTASLAAKPRCVVFDTSSLIESQPGPLNLLMEKWIVCVPFTVLDELDKIHKTDPSKAATAATRTDREWRRRRAHELRNWIAASLKQSNAHIRLQKRMEVVEEYDRKAASNDDSILGFAVFLKRRNENVLFVSEDKFLRIKATSELGSAYAYADLLKMIGVRA